MYSLLLVNHATRSFDALNEENTAASRGSSALASSPRITVPRAFTMLALSSLPSASNLFRTLY